MIIATDIGNTNIVIGLYADGQWRHVWRLETSAEKPLAFYEQAIRHLFLEHDLICSQIAGSVLSSVVPTLKPIFNQLQHGLFGREPVVLGPAAYASLPLGILNPEQIGSDLVANALGAMQAYPDQYRLVVDFGTALTFTLIGDDDQIKGVSIAPGLKTATKALFLNTAQLPDVPLEMPQSALGTDTVSAIQSGLMWGYAGLVSYMVQKIKAESGGAVKVVATGGLSFVYAETLSIFDHVDKNLTLNGLKAAYDLLAKR